MAATQPAPAVVKAAAASQPGIIQSKLLSTYVTVKKFGMEHLAGVLDAFRKNDLPALEDIAVVEAEHFAQGGAGLVEADLAAMFSKMLATKLADSSELQALLATIVNTLGANHPALQAFAQSLLPAKQAAPGPASAAAPTT